MSASRTVPLRATRSGEPGEPAPATLSRRSYRCDGCGESFEGYPWGAGLFMWTRGDETRFEEPPLCETCATKITIGALVKWSTEEEAEE
jgi:hypothetical protein